MGCPGTAKFALGAGGGVGCPGIAKSAFGAGGGTGCPGIANPELGEGTPEGCFAGVGTLFVFFFAAPTLKDRKLFPLPLETVP